MARVVLNTLEVDQYLIGLKPVVSDVDSENSGRSTTGKLMRDRIGVKRKYQLSFAPMSYEDAKAILSSVSPVFFRATFNDPLVGVFSMECHVTDRSWEEIAELPGYIKDLSFNLVER